MTSIGTHTQHTIVYPWVCWLWMCVSSIIAKTKEEQTEFIKGMMKNHYLPAMIGYPHHMHEDLQVWANRKSFRGEKEEQHFEYLIKAVKTTIHIILLADEKKTKSHQIVIIIQLINV